MKHKLVTTLLVVAAVVVATLSSATTTTRPALAAEGTTWPIKDYGTPRSTDSVILKWNEQLLSAIRAYPRETGPTITARALGVLHTATYDAWAPYDPIAKATLQGGAPQQDKAKNTPDNKNEAISYAAYRVLMDLFPPSRFPSKTSPVVYSTPDVLLKSLNPTYNPNNTTTDPSTPAGIGNLAAKLVLDFRHKDNSNQLGTPPYSDTTGYKSRNTWNAVTVSSDPAIDGRWHWQPLCVLTPTGVEAWMKDSSSVPLLTPPECKAPNYAEQSYLTPQWKDVVPFADLSALETKVTGPPKNPDGTYSTTEIRTALADTTNLDDIKKSKAEYWADGPGSEFPPGHTAVFAQAVSRKRGFTLDTDVKLFFAVGNAMLDASIASWRQKYKYDLWRPITAIRQYYKGQKINSWRGPGKGYADDVPGEEWMPYQALNVVTPPFPEYVSGHSTFTGAGSQILQGFTGSDSFGASVEIPVGSLLIEPKGTTPSPQNGPVTLSWPTFTAAADEAGWSRRYGGIHFKSGDEHGRLLGKMVGSNVWSKAQAYIKGYAGFSPTK